MTVVPPVPEPSPRSRTGRGRRVSDEWGERLGRALTVVPPRLRPSLAWFIRRGPVRPGARTMAGVVRVQIFDRAMTLAAQAFTSIFPVLILLGSVLGGGVVRELADAAGLSETSRRVLDDAFGHGGSSTFGVAGGVLFGLVMLVVRPVGSVYLPRALATSSERYGTIGVAFTYIGWLDVVAFRVLLSAILGRVLTLDEGLADRLLRGRAHTGGMRPPSESDRSMAP